ncbi:hypothetical protein EBZ57_02640 [bacterium]|nr:hypothetical protein [bacterium]
MKKDNSESEYQWFLRLNKKLSAEKDKKYGDLLKSMQVLFGDEIKSFDDLENVSTGVFLKNMEVCVNVINQYPDKAGAKYALSNILDERNDLTYLQYCDLFLMLNRSSRDFPYMRGDVANYIVDNLDKSNSEHFLNFLDNLKNDGIDRFVLLLGLKKVDKKYMPKIIELLRRDVIETTNISISAKVARRLKTVSLLKDFKKALPKIKDSEIKRNVQKTIEVLEKEIENNKWKS